MRPFASDIATALQLRPAQVDAALALAENGATVPFIARYRKEATGGLDEVQLRAIFEQAQERTELEARREQIRRSIDEQGKLTPALSQTLARAGTRAELEALYLPFRPKRRTRATIAREKGLEPLAERIWKQENARIADFIAPAKGVDDAEAALAGARDICAEWIAEDATLRGIARARSLREGTIHSKVEKAHVHERGKFDAYHDHQEPLSKAPSHRILAMFRGEAEEVLKVRLRLPDEAIVASLHPRIVRRPQGPFARDLATALEDGWARLLSPSLESELRAELKERADRVAIEVFAENLRHLLIAPAAGMRSVLALDPGLRSGTKLAALDPTGKLLATETLYTERSQAERERATASLLRALDQFTPTLIAVGNGTGEREAREFVRATLASRSLTLPIVSVSEQGASVYSASPLARDEFPTLDVSLRGAISIGRRLQDPLAELVKVEPRSIGVGQYQHDVDQERLGSKLGEVVDSCVNLVGVDANTASPQLLEHVSGIGPKLAQKIVAHREARGPFTDRDALREVSGLGPKTFEQAAGFLRVRGARPLDNSAVHPERYGVVERMARDLGVPVDRLVGKPELVQRIDWQRYVEEGLGEPTLRDVIAELEKPGRDPRGTFEVPHFRDDLQRLEDLREGVVLQGVVTNVTAFGAFVDVGVHQDGLVHVSQLASRFVKNPSDVVKVGDRVTVTVLSVDLARRRLALSMRQG